MQLLSPIEPAKVARIVCDDHHAMFAREGGDVPILPTRFPDMREVIGFETGPMRFVREIQAQALVDQKPHDSGGSDSGTVHSCRGGRSCQGCLRGRPLAGWASA